MMISMASTIGEAATPEHNGLLCRKSLITWSAWLVSMVVYMDTASAVKSTAFGGSGGRADRKPSMSFELVRKDGSVRQIG